MVTYTADENGYNAKVNYEGEAKPQPSQPGSPGGPGGYPSAPGGGFPSSAPSYPSSAPGFPSSAPSYSTGFNQPSFPAAKGPSYAAPQPKNGGY